MKKSFKERLDEIIGKLNAFVKTLDGKDGLDFVTFTTGGCNGKQVRKDRPEEATHYAVVHIIIGIGDKGDDISCALASLAANFENEKIGARDDAKPITSPEIMDVIKKNLEKRLENEK